MPDCQVGIEAQGGEGEQGMKVDISRVCLLSIRTVLCD